MFSHEFTVKLRDTDAAGVVFFAAYFTIAHDVYELALEELGEPLGAWLRELPMPLVKSEASYLSPLRHGERARVDLGVQRVGGSSFELRYEVWVSPSRSSRWSMSDAPLVASEAPPTWRKACELKTIHVAIDPQHGRSVPLPLQLREALERLGPLHPDERPCTRS